MSADLSQIEQMVQELGPVIPQISRILQEERGHWSLCWNDQFWIAMDFHPQRECLLLCAVLGSPDEQQRPYVHAAMLATNALYSGTSSLRIGLNHPDEDLLLFGEHAPSYWTLEHMRGEVVSFAGHAMALAQAIAEPAGSASRPLESLVVKSGVFQALA